MFVPALALALILAASDVRAQVGIQINGLYWGDYDYMDYNYISEVDGGRAVLYQKFVDPDTVNALVRVKYTTNDNAFSPNADGYTQSVIWNGGHRLSDLIWTDAIEMFTVCGLDRWEWRQDLIYDAGGPDGPFDWRSDTMGDDGAAVSSSTGSDIPVSGIIVTSHSSLEYNLENSSWIIIQASLDPYDWTSPDVNGDNTISIVNPVDIISITGAHEDYPFFASTGTSPTDLYEWAINYEMTLDVSHCSSGEAIIGVASIHNSPAKVPTSFNFPDFASTTGLSLVGHAAQSDSVLRLTPDDVNQVGAAWFITKQFVQHGFETTFRFQITDSGGLSVDGQTGGDGFAFVIQNNSDSVIGIGGAGMGYSFIPNPLAVEFDTWRNWSELTGAPWVDDPSDNHVGVHTEVVSNDTALEANALASASLSGIDMSDGAIHTVRITYDPPTMEIFVDNLIIPVLTVNNMDLGTILNLTNGQAFVGFTAGTALAFENHDILNWSFNGTPQLIIDEVQALVDASVLNPDQGDGLTSKLEAAFDSLDGGKTKAACRQLQAFINQVNAFVSAGKLTPEQAQPLIDRAAQIRAPLGCKQPVTGGEE
jgi:hypothetical protein